MKKGQMITLEGLIKALPTIVLGLLLLFIIGRFVYDYMNPPLTDPQKDFKTLVTDMEDIMQAPPSAAKLQINSPIRGAEKPENSYAISLYPPVGELPPECHKQACICLTEIKDIEPVRTCVPYPDVKACSTVSNTCGKELCFQPSSITVYPGWHSIPVSKECNTVRLG